MKRRLLSLFLAFVMVIGLLPITALAAAVTVDTATVDLEEGDTITLKTNDASSLPTAPTGYEWSGPVQSTDCGQSAHTHSSSYYNNCYSGSDSLICTKDEHAHSEDCYDTSETICGRRESWSHRHSWRNGCYALECTLDEHEHSVASGCYAPTCGLDEHTHENSCYAYTWTLVEENLESKFFYRFSENSSNSTLYYTTDGSTLRELGRGEELKLDRYAPVAFYVAIAPGYTSGSQFQQRSGSDKYEYDWKGGTYTPIDSLTTTTLGSGSNQINITTATELAKSTFGCDYEFHYSATGTEYRYREFEITGTSTHISVEYSVDGDKSLIVDNNNYRHPNVTDSAYADYLTQITIPSDTPTKRGYTFAGWAFRGGIYRAGDTLQIKDLWSAEINTDVTYTFVAQWTANPSELTITKELFGGPTELPADFEITVTGSNGYSTTLDQNDEHIFSDGKYTWVLNNLTAATYTVTESGCDIIGYTQLPGSVTHGSVYLYAGQEGTIALENAYEINTYTVIWAEENGNTLETDANVPYGTSVYFDDDAENNNGLITDNYENYVSFGGEIPQKAATGQYTYAFAGWSPEVSVITGNVTFRATYAPTTNTYTVTWVDEDGTKVLETDENVAYGTTPIYNGEIPTKAPDAQYHYVFAGWSPAISTVTGNATYKATYTQGNVRTYTVIWHDYNRVAIETDLNVPYGATPTYNGETPTKPSDASYTYEFTGWKFYRGTALVDGKIVGSVEFEPVFDAVPIPRTATVEVILNGTMSDEGETVAGGTHTDVSALIADADNAIYLKLADGTGEYITLSNTGAGVYSYSGIANGEYKIYAKTGTTYTQLGVQLITIDNCDDTDYAPFYSVSYADGEANNTATGMPGTEYYYTGSHVDVSSEKPEWEDHVFAGWTESGVSYQPSSALERVHLDDAISAPHVLTAVWEDTVNVNVVVEVNRKGDTEYYKNALHIYLTQETSNGTHVNVPGSQETISNWYGSGSGSTLSYSLTGVYTDLDKDGVYSAEATLFGYKHVSTTVSALDSNTNTYTVTVELEYDPTGFELQFDVYVDASVPARFVPAEVDVKITRWDGDSWETIADHTNSTTTVYIDTASTVTVDGKAYYKGTGSHHVYAFDTNQKAYLYRIELVNLDAIGTYTDTLARAAYYSVSMSDLEQPNVQYVSAASGFFPAGAYTGTVSAGTTCENGLSVTGGLYGTHVYNDNGEYVQHDMISTYISAHPYTIAFDLNGGTSAAIESMANRFTVPVLDSYVPTREGYSFAGWYLNADGTGNAITGGEYINTISSLAAGGTLTLYAKWDADFTVSGKVEANMGYPCSDTSRTVTVTLQRKNAGGAYVDYRSATAKLDTLNGTVASGTYEFKGVPADADYRIYVPHSAGIVTYQNELSTDYSANHYAVVRGTDDVTTTEKDESLEAIVNVSITAKKFDLAYQVDASAISTGYRPTDILIKLCHDHNDNQYYEAIAELSAIRGIDLNTDTDGISQIYTDVSVPTHHTNGTLFNYVFSVYSYDFAGENDKQHVHHLNDAAARKTFAPFVIDYTGPVNYKEDGVTIGENVYDQDIILNAIFKPNTYAINYNLNNGSWAVDGSAIRTHVWSYDTEITTTPVREGYVFNGWIASVTDGVEKKTDGTWVVPADIWTDVTLTAQWTPENYTITYDLADGALPEDTSNPVKYTVESGAITLVNPVREGYTFTGWTGTELNGAIETVIIPAGSTGNRTYTATWTIDSYDITVEVENGTASETGIISVNHGGNLTVTFTANTGYALDSVTVDGEVTVLTDGAYTFTNVTAAHSIKVVYATDTVLGSDNIPDKYQAVVTYMVVNGSFAEDFTDKVKFTLKEYQNGVWNNVSPAPTLGDTIPVVGTHMVPNEGRTTEGSWNTVPTAETAVTRDRTFVWTFTGVQRLSVTYSDYAKYQNDHKTPEMSTAVVKYNDMVEVDPNGGSWTTDLVSGTESTYTQTRYVNVIEDSALSNPTRDYYIFVGWKWEQVSAVDLEGTFTAQWVPVEYAIRYHLDGGALAEGQSNPETYTIEDSFALVAPVKTGYVFEGWTGTGLSAATKEVSVSAGSVGDRAYTAAWSAATNTPYTIKYYLEDLNADTFSEYTDAQVNCEGTTGATGSVDVSNGSTDVNFKSFNGFTFDDDNTNNVCSGAIAADGSLELKLYYTRNSYTVQYVNDDGTTVLQNPAAEYGVAIPGYTGSTPVTTQSYEPAQYTCAFDGWTLESGTAGTGNTVIGNMTYKAAYIWTTNTYTVTWVDYDGSVFKTESVDYGTTPNYGGTPTREQDSQNSYAFKEWLDKDSKLSDGKVVCDVTLTADYTPTARLFTGYAEIYLEVNGVDTLTDVETLLGTGVKLYFSADESTYYELSRNDGKYSNSSMPNGNYKLYSSADGNTYSKVCDQILVIYGSTATAKEYFHAVTYAANGGSGGPDSPAYYHEGSAVTVPEPAPVRSGYLFQGWWYDADDDSSVDAGEIYQAGDMLTSGIYQNYALKAQWKKDIRAKVNLTVTVNHSLSEGTNPNPGTDLKIDLTRREVDTSNNYTEVVGKSVTKSGWYTTESGTTVLTYNDIFTELSCDYEYSVNVFLEHYQVTGTPTITPETDSDGNITYNVSITLQYNPDLFNLSYNVVVDSSVPADFVPKAVDVKVIAYDANTADAWAPISRHEHSSAEVLIDRNTRTGTGSYNVPVHKTATEGNHAPYLYRVAVLGFTLADGTELYVDPASSALALYPSDGTAEYADGAYYAEVSLSFNNDQDVKNGAYGHSENNHTPPFHQHGTLTITIKAKTDDVELDLNYDGDDTDSENDILTVIEDQFRIPTDIQTNAVYQPTREGYTFEGWYTDAACTDGNEVAPGTVLTQDVTLYAKWKSLLTVSGNVAIAGDYGGGTIYFADRPTSVIVTLYRKAPGSSHAVEYGIPVTVTIDNGAESTQKNPGTGSYEFKNLPNDGSTYHITVLARNFTETFWNEVLTTGETEYNKYTAINNTAADSDNNNTATVHAYLTFEPQTFDLDWEINASAIGADYRPTKASTLVICDDSPAEGYTWGVITQQIINGVETGQESNFGANGFSAEDYDVWQFHTLGHAYNYAIRLQSLTYKPDGSTETTVTDFASVPFSISYVYPAFYKATTGDQDILLTATLTPKSYTVTLDANGGTVNGKDSDTVAHTWSKPTQITAIPVREGYVFNGWTANVNGMYDGANISAAVSQNVTLTAQWIEIQSVTFTGESKTVTYNGAEQTVTGITVTGLPEGYTYSSLSYSVSGKDVVASGYTGSFSGTVAIKDGDNNDVTAFFTPSYVPGTLTINPAMLTVTAKSESKAYDGNPFTGFAYEINGFVGGEPDTVVTGNVTYTGDAVDAVNAGTYTITPGVSGLSATNYTFKAVNGTLTIGKVNLTIKAADKTKVFDGQSFGNFTYSATGFVNGENSSVLSGKVTYNTEAVTATAVGTYDIIPVVTGLSADNYTFTAEKGVLTILEDSNGDGVADQSQKKVTFKVVNGTWGDGTTDKVFYVTLDASDVGTLVAPTDMTPNTGYKNGSWNTELPATVSGTEEISFTYSYSLITGLSYTVNYLERGTDTAIHAQKIQDGKTYGDTVETANEIITVTGYSYDSADASTLTIGTGENVLNLYYVKDATQTHSVSAQVQYFFGDTLTEAKAKTTADATEEVVTASGWIGDTVTVTVAPNTTNKFTGYQHGTTEGALSYSVAAGEASDTVPHEVKVYYIKNTEHTHSVSAQVQYFYGETLEKAKEKTTADATEETVTASGWIGEAVTVTVTANTTDKFRGYKHHSTEGEPSYSIEANAADANHVVKVYYVKDEGKIHSVSAQVQYFYGETLADAQAKTVPDAIEAVVTASSWIEEEVTVTVTVDTNNKFTGYAHNSTQGDLSYTLAPGAAGSSTVNVVKVYHVKNPNQTKTLSYTVEYYKAGVKVEGDTQTVTEIVWVNAPDTLTVVKSGINTKDKYSGYKLSHTDPATIPNEIADDGVIKIYYVKDETQTKELSYTVKYYKDDVLVEDDTQVERKTVWANDPETMTVDKSKIDAENKYVGYKLDTVNTAEIPDTLTSGSVIKIYYVKNNAATKTLSYTVEYFKDGVLADTQVEYQDVWVNAEAVLDVDISKINTTNKYVGYKYDSIVPATIPAKINNGDVIKVYYIRDTTQTHSVSAQVQYFYGETLEEAKEKTRADASDDVVTASGWIGETVTVTVIPNTNDQFIGYKHGGTEGELSYSVAAGAASDTVTHEVKVYYVKDAVQTKELSYTVEYYKDGEKADTQTVSKAVWVNDSNLPVDKSAINTTDKYDGYKFVSTDPSPIPDTIAANGVIKVNYVKDDGKTKILSYTVEYYKDGEKADTQTESKAVWVNEPDILSVDKSKINTTDKYGGYKFISTDPATIPDTIVNGGVIKVYYESVFVPPVVDPKPPVVVPEKPEPPKLNKEDHFAYIIGKDDGLVHPLDHITRAETATIFFRMLLEESRQYYWTQENNFVDVKITDWFNNAASTLSNAGIMTGRPGGQFAPYTNITRGEFATMAVRFFLDEDVEIAENNLTDVKGHWAEANINLAYALGLITGYPDNTFKPNQEITRAEAMVIVNRVLERHPHKDHLLSNMITWPDNMDPNVWYYADVQEATNSHLYAMMTDENGQKYEIWQQLLPVRDWAALEKAWSDSNSSHNPGEVVDVNRGQ